MEHRRQSMSFAISRFLSRDNQPTNLGLTDYKNKGGLKQDDLRRRREEQQVEIRRQKREENISKRRNLVPSSGIDSDDEAGGSGGLDPPVRTITVISVTC
jgi:hypothetical protein